MNSRAIIAVIFIVEVILEAGLRLKTNLVQGLSLKNLFLYGLLAISLGITFGNYGRQSKYAKSAHVGLLVLGLIAAASVVFVPELGGFRRYQPLEQLLGVKGLLFDSLIALLVFSCALPRTTDYWKVVSYIVAIIGLFVIPMIVEVRMPSVKVYGLVTQELRPRGPLGEPNQTAAVLAMILPIAVVLAIRNRRGSRLWWAFVAILIAAGLVATGSRGGVVAATAGLTILGFTIRREFRMSTKILVVSAIPIALVAGWMLLPEGYQALIERRVVSIADFQSNAAKASAGRTLLWSEALEQWRAAPILGHGWGYYREATGNVTHNEFLVFLVDTGVVGLALYLYVWANILRLIAAARKSGRGDALVLSAYMSGVVSLLVAVFFVNLYLPWLIVWSLVGLICAHCSAVLLQGRVAVTRRGQIFGGLPPVDLARSPQGGSR